MKSIKNLIYLIDDSKSIRSFFSSALVSNGYEVESFDNPILCMDELKKKSPDCILTDYEMPNLNGVEFCKHIKSSKDLSGIPVILLSTHENDEHIIEALKAGADDYLPKRTNPEIIIAKIKLMTELKRHREQIIAQERMRTYKATICRVGHDLNNVMTILLPLLKKNEALLNESGDKSSEFYKKLQQNLLRLADNIKAIISHSEEGIEFEHYAGDEEMISLNMKKAK